MNISIPFRAFDGDGQFVFASYAHADRATVYPILDHMNRVGVAIWYDEGIPPSESWKKVIAEKLSRCDAFMVFLTRTSVARENVLDEIAFAEERHKNEGLQFIPVYLESFQLPSELKLTIGRIQAIIKSNLSETLFLEKLVSAVSKMSSTSVTRQPAVVQPPAAKPAARPAAKPAARPAAKPAAKSISLSSDEVFQSWLKVADIRILENLFKKRKVIFKRENISAVETVQDVSKFIVIYFEHIVYYTESVEKFIDKKLVENSLYGKDIRGIVVSQPEDLTEKNLKFQLNFWTKDTNNICDDARHGYRNYVKKGVVKEGTSIMVFPALQLDCKSVSGKKFEIFGIGVSENFVVLDSKFK